MGIRKTLKKIKRLSRGFTLLEAMISTTILVIAVTSSLQIYLRTSLLVEENRERTMAVTHQKMAMEEIRSWPFLSDEVINSYNWTGWLNEATDNELLPNEEIAVDSSDWIIGYSSSPRRVEVAIEWDGVRRKQRMELIGGFI